MLREIKQLLAERGSMELRDLAIHFETDAPAMLGMLECLESHNQIQRTTVSCGSGSCGGCPGCGELQPKRLNDDSLPDGITFWSVVDEPERGEGTPPPER